MSRLYSFLLALVCLLPLPVSSKASTSVTLNTSISQTGDGNSVGSSSLLAEFLLQNGPGNSTTTQISAQTDNGQSEYDNVVVPSDNVGVVVFSNPNSLPATGVMRYIPAHFHFLSYNGEGLFGTTNDNQLAVLANKQLENLNAAYKSIKTVFVLMTVTKTIYRPWFLLKQGSKEEDEMKSTLRKGDCAHLNIYSVSPRSVDDRAVVGWATRISGCEKDMVYDGAVVSYAALEGSGDELYGEGDTLIHESGHWCDLLDEADCGEDYTPACDTDNFMDCSPDVCRKKFTSKQLKVMDAQLCFGRKSCKQGQKATGGQAQAGEVVLVQVVQEPQQIVDSVEGGSTTSNGQQAGGGMNSGMQKKKTQKQKAKQQEKLRAQQLKAGQSRG